MKKIKYYLFIVFLFCIMAFPVKAITCEYVNDSGWNKITVTLNETSKRVSGSISVRGMSSSVKEAQMTANDFLDSSGKYACPKNVYYVSANQPGTDRKAEYNISFNKSVSNPLNVAINSLEVSKDNESNVKDNDDKPINDNKQNDDNSQSDGNNTADPNLSTETFCERSGILTIFRVVGYVIFVIKIIVPLLLIILATVDFSKAIMSNNDKSNNEAIGSLIKRVIIAVIIYLIPTVLNFAINIIDDAVDTTNKFTNCTSCLLDPGNCDQAGLGIGK